LRAWREAEPKPAAAAEAAMVMRIFPVAAEGRPTFSDDWHKPRSGGRLHQGNDIFAPEGTPVLAVDDGHVFFGSSSLGGLLARLKADDGATYLYIHLSAFDGDERRVQVGEVIGYVGHTGNAAGTPDHVHFEVHPIPGEGAINPFPLLLALKTGAPPAEVVPPDPLARAAEAARRAVEQAEQDSRSHLECLPLVSSSSRDGGGADA
jgi:murein DD-endopeptidase MepM/ murein hydrolase activator NlpD